MTEKPLPFEQERDVKVNRSLKIGAAKKSQFQTQLEDRKKAEVKKQKFEEKADSFMQNRQEQQVKGAEIANDYFAVLRDRTTPDNKGVVKSQNEIQIKDDLVSLLNDINNDPNQKFDGFGSVTGISLLIKSIFELRDRINIQEREINLLKKQIESRNETKEQ